MSTALASRRLTIRQGEHLKHVDSYDGPRRWFYVYIYDTIEELRRAARRYDRGHRTDHSDTYAVCQLRPQRSRYDRKAKQWQPVGLANFMGVIRFHLSDGPRIDIEVMVHEVTHMAIEIYRLDFAVAYMADLGDGNTTEQEEILCFIIGDLANQVGMAFLDAGL